MLRVALIGYWIVLFIATHLPPRKVPKTGIGDKAWHFGGYAILAALLVLVLYKRNRVMAFMVSIAVCLLYGAFDELTQPLVGRSRELFDWFADGVGALVGAAVALIALHVAPPRRDG